eukprot:497227_1
MMCYTQMFCLVCGPLLQTLQLIIIMDTEIICPDKACLVLGYIRCTFESQFNVAVPSEMKQICVMYLEFDSTTITISFMRNWCYVGQTSLILKYMQMDVNEKKNKWKKDLFGDLYEKDMVYRKAAIHLNIIDVGRSQCEFTDHDRRMKLLEISDCVVFGYDLSSCGSLEDCMDIIEKLLRSNEEFFEDKKKIKVLCGYKSDIQQMDPDLDRCILDACLQLKCKTSAVNNDGVDRLFDDIINEYLNIYDELEQFGQHVDAGRRMRCAIL